MNFLNTVSYCMRSITFFVFQGQKTLSPCNKAIASLNIYFLDGETIFLSQKPALQS